MQKAGEDSFRHIIAYYKVAVRCSEILGIPGGSLSEGAVRIARLRLHGIRRAVGQQRRVRTEPDEPALIEHQDGIGVAGSFPQSLTRGRSCPSGHLQRQRAALELGEHEIPARADHVPQYPDDVDLELIQPVALGSGQPLFKDLPGPLRLDLTDAKRFPDGTAIHVYTTIRTTG